MKNVMDAMLRLMQAGHTVHINNDVLAPLKMAARVELYAVPHNSHHTVVLHVEVHADDRYVLQVEPWDAYYNEGFSNNIANFFEKGCAEDVFNSGSGIKVDGNDLSAAIDMAIQRAKRLSYHYDKDNNCYFRIN